MLGRSESTISRELKRNTGKRGYRPKQAHEKARVRKAVNAKRISEATWEEVKTELTTHQCSPEHISGVLKKEKGMAVSHEWIYLQLYRDKTNGGKLYQHLRQKKARHKRSKSYKTRGVIPNRQSIHTRPEVVEARSRIGDWEVDTMIGKNHQQALVTVVDRTSGYTLIQKVDHRTSALVTAAIIQLLATHLDKVQTITSDNGKEFADHQAIAHATGADFFFADPYSSWQRGTNENTNGLIRQYFPKGSDFSSITQSDCDRVMAALNHRPRKRLAFSSPHEVFFNHSLLALHS